MDDAAPPPLTEQGPAASAPEPLGAERSPDGALEQVRPAEPEPASSPRRALAWTAAGLGAAVVLAGLVIALVATWADAGARLALFQAMRVSAAEQGVVDEALAQASAISAEIEQGTSAYREVRDQWRSSEEWVRTWREQDADPVLQEPNPGGDLLDGGADERAFLGSIGAGDVQVLLEGGEQNCGFASREDYGAVAIGGCYRPDFRDWLFLAWDRGVPADEVWPIFVHEAMHWYQWEHYAAVFDSAAQAGVSGDPYDRLIESDASCRAVFVHGVPRAEYADSSSPCDVDDWSEGWIVDRIAELGVTVVAPDPEAFEVQPAVRP